MTGQSLIDHLRTFARVFVCIRVHVRLHHDGIVSNLFLCQRAFSETNTLFGSFCCGTFWELKRNKGGNVMVQHCLPATPAAKFMI